MKVGVGLTPAGIAARRLVSAPLGPVGFALNGSSNTTLKAMLSRVAAGTGRGTIVMKGDSTTVGVGGALTGGAQSSSVATQSANARQYRTSAVLATGLSAAGYATLDGAMVGDHAFIFYAVPLASYDPRISWGNNPWAAAGATAGPPESAPFAGANYLNGNTYGALRFASTSAADTFEVVLYNTGGTATITVNGAAPASIVAPGATVSSNAVTPPNTSSGFTKIVVTASSNAVQTISIVPSGNVLLRSLTAYSSATKSISILNHASSGSTSTDAASSGSNWQNLDALKFDAPDLTIINTGLNGSTNTTTYGNNLQALITAAKLSGDVLLVSPNPANPTFSPTATQTALRDVAASVAASNGVAYLDMFTYFGSWSAVSARTADGLVHPAREMYSEIGGLYKSCIQVMAA